MVSELQTERRGGTLVLTLSGPASRNSLSEQACAAGIEALSVAESDPAVRSIVLRGEGDHFSSGTHPHHPLEADEAECVAHDQMAQRLHDFIEALRVCPKPVIAAVEGTAAGGGFALALACDLIVAATDARIVMASLGSDAPPETAVARQLMQRVPRALALEWLWLGAPVPTDRLQALGLVNRLAGTGQALAQALALAEQLHDAAPAQLACIKDAVNAWTAPSPTPPPERPTVPGP